MGGRLADSINSSLAKDGCYCANINTKCQTVGDEFVVRPQLNNLTVLKFQLNLKSRDYLPGLELPSSSTKFESEFESGQIFT